MIAIIHATDSNSLLVTRLVFLDEVAQHLIVIGIWNYDVLRTVQNSLDDDEQAAVPSH